LPLLLLVALLVLNDEAVSIHAHLVVAVGFALFPVLLVHNVLVELVLLVELVAGHPHLPRVVEVLGVELLLVAVAHLRKRLLHLLGIPYPLLDLLEGTSLRLGLLGRLVL